MVLSGVLIWGWFWVWLVWLVLSLFDTTLEKNDAFRQGVLVIRGVLGIGKDGDTHFIGGYFEGCNYGLIIDAGWN
jgi:hypothetical protein